MFYGLNRKSGEMICKMNDAGIFVSVNNGTTRITGYSEDELIGMHFSALLREDYKNFAINFYLRQVEKKSPATYLELPVVKKNGHHIWLGQKVCLEENDNRLHLASSARDITDKISKKKQLWGEPAMDIPLVEYLQSGIVIVDANRKIITANKEFCKMFNIPLAPEDLIGNDYWMITEYLKKTLIHPGEFDNAEKALTDKRILHRGEALWLAKGNIYERDYIPMHTGKKYTGAVWKYTDVTEQYKIINELLRNERKYKSVIDTMNLGLLEVDNYGYIQSCNESFCEMLSYKSIDELIGKQALETLLDKESQQIMKDQIALREQGVSGAYEIRIKKANCIDSAWVLISGTSLFDDHNNVVGSIGIHLDITQQKITAEKLQEAKSIESHLEAQKKAMELLEEKVAERTNEIVAQKKVIEKKNEEVTQSLYYALRIQQALLPDKKKILETLPESFFLFKPKDIVSGDFYFYSKKGDHVIIAAADCTGHGVPGAFMSMLGSDKLADAVQKCVIPGEILALLDRGIKDALRHSENERSILDGLDISLCSINVASKTMQFAGAHRPAWIIRNSTGQLEEIKGTKKDIGGLINEAQLFETHYIEMEEGDTFYLFTDGFADQFGDNNKRLMTKKFKEQLLSIQHLSMNEQEISLETFFGNWKGAQEQTDDILVIGIRL